jgi:hypothetical protein
MIAVDRDLFQARLADERHRFGNVDPRSATLSAQEGENLPTGAPMAWMTRWT